MISRFCTDDLPRIFTNVMAELIRDGQCNWGRVISAYALAVLVARRCLENDEPEKVDQVRHLVENFVSDRMGFWIADQGGWESLEKFFPHQPNPEKRDLKILLFILLGVGILVVTTVF